MDLIDRAIGYATANAKAAKTADERQTWEAHTRNCESVKAEFDVMAQSHADLARGLVNKHRENERLKAALRGIAEFCSGDDRTLSAIGRLASVQNTAERALRTLEQTGDRG